MAYNVYTPVTLGDTITVSFYAKTNLPSKTMFYSTYFGAGNSGSSFSPALTNTWKKFQLTWTESATYNFYQYFFINGDASVYYVDIADIQVEIGKGYATPFTSSTRGSTVETGGGWKDLSKNGIDNNGDLTSMTYDTGDMIFNGTDTYIPLSGIITLSNTFTITSWVKIIGATGLIWGCGANGHDNWFSVSGSKVNIYVSDSSDTNNTSLSGTTTMNTTNWYFLSTTVNVSTIKVYLNGIEENSATLGFTIGAWNSSVNSIGRRGSISSMYFNGEISTVAAYDRVLSTDEILQNYNATKVRFAL